MVLGITAAGLPGMAESQIVLPAIAAEKLPAQLTVNHAGWRALVDQGVGIVERRVYEDRTRYFLFQNLAARAQTWSKGRSDAPVTFDEPVTFDQPLKSLEIFEVPGTI